MQLTFAGEWASQGCITSQTWSLLQAPGAGPSQCFPTVYALARWTARASWDDSLIPGGISEEAVGVIRTSCPSYHLPRPLTPYQTSYFRLPWEESHLSETPLQEGNVGNGKEIFLTSAPWTNRQTFGIVPHVWQSSTCDSRFKNQTMLNLGWERGKLA